MFVWQTGEQKIGFDQGAVEIDDEGLRCVLVLLAAEYRLGQARCAVS
jgi:hypothetical protein